MFANYPYIRQERNYDMKNVRYVLESLILEELNDFHPDLCDWLDENELTKLSRKIADNLIKNNLIVKED